MGLIRAKMLSVEKEVVSRAVPGGTSGKVGY
jgi:hypothetical protein